MARIARTLLRGAQLVSILLAGVLAVAAAEQGENIPRKPGQCVKTEISELGSRLEGNPSMGSAITYANGIVGVSYDVEPALRRSRVGDPVTLCLVSVPTGCPKGDDRGKKYSALNHRTKERWTLPDASHMCGGA